MSAQIPGELSIWIALLANVLAGGAFFLAARGREEYEGLAKRAYGVFTLFTAIACAYLYYLFFTHNYAFKYVFEYNESQQPFIYVLSGFWGGQEGTYLLWLLFSALCGYLIIKRGGQYRHWAMSVFALVNLFFLLILTKLSPFALLPQPQPDGLGLNPLLRDPWMVIHPPIIFVGYAMAAVPFALAMAALIKNDYSDWVRRAFPWVAVSALFLAAGNILGGYWAYKTLGWGGYWAWDPVENSSFVPWMIGLGLLHGLIIERRTGALRKTNLLLSAFLFLLVVYGTFLTRSGVLADFSVHSFTDLGINQYLIAFMVFFTVLSLALFLFRAAKIPSQPLDYNIFGREFSLFIGLAALFIFGVVVLFWSSLPILSGWFSDEPRAADIATYNSFALPLSILMAFLLTVAPFTNYGGYRLPDATKRAVIAFAAAAVLGFGLFMGVLGASFTFAVVFTLVLGSAVLFLFKSDLRKSLIPALGAFVVTLAIAVLLGVSNYLYVLFFATAGMATVANVIAMASYFPDRWKQAGGQLTHFGFGLMLIGVLASSAFDSNVKLVIPRGETKTADQYNLAVAYQGMEHDIEHPNNELILNVDDGSGSKVVSPQLYYSPRMDGIMRKPFIDRFLLYDLYMAPEQVQRTGAEESGLRLSKGQTRTVGGIDLTFLGFEMGSHGEQSGALTVAAEIQVSNGSDSTQLISPAIVHSEGPDGSPTVNAQPAVLKAASGEFQVTVERILADQGAVVVAIPGLTESAPTDRLVLDVSKKPVIGLVWVGTTLILIGSVVTVIRRRSELVRPDRV